MVGLNNGWLKLPNGLIIQWGYSLGDNWRTIEFPIPFSNKNYVPILTVDGVGRHGNECAHINSRDSKYTTTTSMRVSGFFANGVYWAVIGN